MKKVLSMITVSGLALLTVASVGVSVFADTTTEGTETTVEKSKHEENPNGPGTTVENGISDGTSEKGFIADPTDPEKPAVGKSTAQFRISAKGNLTLDAVPDMNFGEKSAQDLMTSDQTLGLMSGIVDEGEVTSKNKKDGAFDGNKDYKLIVSDYRFASKHGWELKVSASEFSSVNEGKLQPLAGTKFTLNFTATNEKDLADGDAKRTFTPTPIENITFDTNGTAESTIKTDKEHTGQFTNVYTLNEQGSSLFIPKQKDIRAGIYQSTLTWTLSDTAVPDATL